jgi:hypothetical protein
LCDPGEFVKASAVSPGSLSDLRHDSTSMLKENLQQSRAQQHQDAASPGVTGLT